MNPNTYRKLINDYNKNPKRYNDKEAEASALMARSLGENFRRESKPFRKGLYEAGEMATLGLLPNSWKPQSRGESVFGQTVIDKMASGAGMVAGLGGGLVAGAKAVKGASGMLSGKGGDALRKVKQRMSQAGVSIKEGAAGRIASNLGQAGRAYGQGAVNVATLQGMRAAQALANRVGIPYETAVRILQYSGGGIAGAGALDYTMGGFGD